MKLEDREPTPNELFMSLHGSLFALITALRRTGRLPETEFLEQMRNSELSLLEEGAPMAARLIAEYSQALSNELGREASSR